MFNLGPLKLQNPYIRSATACFLAGADGAPTDRFVNIYDSLAQGRIGMIVMEHAFISLVGRSPRAQLGIHCDEMIPHHKQLITYMKYRDPQVIICAQLNHFGAKSQHPNKININYMTDEQRLEVIQQYHDAAVRAKAAGYDAVQVHAAHGYFLSQSISSFYNQREDDLKPSDFLLLRQVLDKVRQVGIPMGVKINSDDFTGEAGMNAKQFCKIAAGITADFVEISGGTQEGKYTWSRMGSDSFYYKHVAQELVAQNLVGRQNFIVTGGFEKVADTEEAAALGFKFFGFSRKFMRNDKFLIDDSKKCVRCNQCRRELKPEETKQCIFAQKEIEDGK